MPDANLSSLKPLMNSLLEKAPTWGLKLLGVVVVWIVGRWLAGKLGRLTQGLLDRRKMDPTISRFLGTMVRSLVLIVVVLAILGMVGIETASVAAILAAAGFAVGMALQGNLANFAAGVLLVLFRPFRVGDVVEVAGQTGKVDAIDLLVTTLDTPDNRRVIIGNSAVLGGIIVNYTHNPLRRADVPVGTDYGADLKATREALERAIERVAVKADGEPHQVFLAGLGGSSIDWQVRVWCKPEDYFTCIEQTVQAVKESLDEAGIGIPFPQMDVHLDGRLEK